MLDRNARSGLIHMEIGTPEFLGLLIENPISEFRNMKWRFQYGGLKL